MSVNVIVYGAEQTSDEYVAALKLKQIIQDSLPNSAIGEIVLFASATSGSTGLLRQETPSSEGPPAHR